MFVLRKTRKRDTNWPTHNNTNQIITLLLLLLKTCLGCLGVGKYKAHKAKGDFYHIHSQAQHKLLYHDKDAVLYVPGSRQSRPHAMTRHILLRSKYQRYMKVNMASSDAVYFIYYYLSIPIFFSKTQIKSRTRFQICIIVYVGRVTYGQSDVVKFRPKAWGPIESAAGTTYGSSFALQHAQAPKRQLNWPHNSEPRVSVKKTCPK